MTALFYLLGFLCGFAAGFLASYIIRSRSKSLENTVTAERSFLGILCD